MDELGLYDQALGIYQEALEIYQVVRGKSSLDSAFVIENKAHVIDSQASQMDDDTETEESEAARKKYTEAESLYRQVLEIKIANLDTNHIEIAITKSNLASNLASQHRYTEAYELYQQALDVNCKIFGEMHSNVAKIYDNMGQVLDAQDNLQRALEFYQLALDIKLSVPKGELQTTTGITLFNCGQVKEGLGDFGDALAMYRRAFKIFETALGPDHPSTVQVSEAITDLENEVSE